MKDNTKDKETILSLLKNTPVALTSAELRTRLRAKSLKRPEYEVTRVLRVLQSEQMVRLERGRWNLIATSPKTTSPFGSDKKDFKPTANWTKPLTTSTTSEASPWTPGNSHILNKSIPVEGTIEVESKSDIFSGAWGTFRKLLNYYIDCVKNDGGYEASGYLTDVNKRFIYLRQVGNWYPKVREPWKLNIPLGQHYQDFIRNASSLGEDGVLILGYPFQAWSTSECVLVKPIFTYQLRFAFNTNHLSVWCEDPWPEINLDWLTNFIKEPDQQKVFLNICGLMDRGGGDESFGELGGIVNQPDLQTLARGIITFVARERLHETLQPENVISQSLGEKPVSGIYNRAVLMIGKRAKYTSSLLKELDKISKCSDETLDRTALKFIFKARDEIADESIVESKQEPITLLDEPHEGIVLDTCALNGDQRRSVASLITEDLTVITGPPGTGKSQVVSAAMTNARLIDQTVIFSSRNHKAIDAVVERLNINTEKPIVIRANSKGDSYSTFGFKEAIDQLLREESDQNVQKRWNSIRKQFENRLRKRGEWGKQTNKIQNLRDELGELEQEMASISEDLENDLLVELDKDAKSFPRKEIMSVENSIGFLRDTEGIVHLYTRLYLWVKSFVFNGKLKSLDRYLKKKCLIWQKTTHKTKFTKLLALADQLPSLHRASKYCELKIKAKPVESELKDLPELELLVSKIKKVTEELQEITKEAIALDIALRTGLPPEADRETFANLLASLKRINTPITDATLRRDTLSMLENYSSFLLKYFPLWAVTNLSIRSRIPLIGGLFDLAIIDEASQCDIPSAIPILFRAKRVGVVGDPHQLSHVANIKKSRDILLRERHNVIRIEEQRFSYPETSLYDLFAQTNGVNPTMLKETYRSAFGIAEYSNKNFYGGSLQVLTAADRLKVPKGSKTGIHWTEIVSDVKSAGPSGCIALEEVDAVFEVVKKLLVDNNFDGTVGVVTPFHQQKIRLIDKLLTPDIPLELRMRAKLIIDTAHGFQGDERDVMVMSLCGGPTMPSGSLGFIRKTANLMNVAVSRARAVLHVIGNKSWASESGIPHLQQLTLPPRDPRSAISKTQWFPHESPWEENLYKALREKGVEPEPQYPTLGRRLDMALISKEKKIDIEVDGDSFHRNPDGTRKRDDVWRDIQMQGAGWKVMRFWVYQLREDMDKCVNKILKAWR
jgi:very-short-patch-repair endonuclease/AAA15 family ATPase/GTPase